MNENYIKQIPYYCAYINKPNNWYFITDYYSFICFFTRIDFSIHVAIIRFSHTHFSVKKSFVFNYHINRVHTHTHTQFKINIYCQCYSYSITIDTQKNWLHSIQRTYGMRLIISVYILKEGKMWSLPNAWVHFALFFFWTWMSSYKYWIKIIKWCDSKNISILYNISQPHTDEIMTK